MSDLEKFKASVEAYLEKHGMTPTRFGREAANDPSFVFQLREGRELRTATRERVVAYMKANSRRRSAA